MAYIYTSEDGRSIRVEDRPDGSADVATSRPDPTGRAWALASLPPEQRLHAAGALAGRGYRVVSADDAVSIDPGPHAHEWIEDLDRCAVVGCDAVHPSKVRVGDVVEVTHSHGYAGLTVVITGEVYKVDDDPVHPFHLIGYGSPQIGDNTTVRWVRRAEPEPDPEQVQALWKIGFELGEKRGEPLLAHDECRDMVRRGVRVDGGADG